MLQALVLSLLVHVLAFGTWKWGNRHNWWTNVHFPSWMQISPKLLTPALDKKLMPKPKEKEPPQLTFIDVDPAMAQPTPPKNAKFYSANNSIAANPTPLNLPDPDIKGHQTQMPKTVENAKNKPQPLQPSPPKPVVKNQPEKKAPPEKAETPGEMAMAKPRPKPQEAHPETTVDTGTENKPQPIRERPKTISEAMARKGMLGEKSRQHGGANRLSMDSSVDAQKSVFGDYDAEFIDAVRSRWYQLLEERTTEGSGKVEVRFRMLPDGRITNLEMPVNQMSELFGLICQRAILDPAPYRPWPEEMRKEIPNDFRDVTFTFYYSTE